MGLFSWIVVGLLAGWIAGMVTGRRSQGCITKIAVGVIGALIGGALDNAAGGDGLGAFGLRSVLVAAVGATIFLFVLEAVEGRRGSRRLR
ncbi:MAG: hypothetical protein QOJ09_1985 [Actinomycetota bacterium]|jgi:uncharacterized membrane protein YeaQ/YmgE (transglycosylase-associated protein family)|nr:hypothetical protein [Actinomycetota bacterium]